MFPTPTDLRDRLQLRYRVGVLLLGSEMLSEQRRAREERRALAATEAAHRLDRQQEAAQEREIQIELGRRRNVSAANLPTKRMIAGASRRSKNGSVNSNFKRLASGSQRR